MKKRVIDDLSKDEQLTDTELDSILIESGIDPNLPVDVERNKSVARPNPKGNLVTSQSRREANTIRPICRAFLRFPHNRGLSLSLSDVRMTTYQTAFKLPKSQGIETYLEKQIFFAQPSWTALLSIFPLCASALLADTNREAVKRSRFVCFWPIAASHPAASANAHFL
ncbi:hypothetical protein [Pseudomonas orientalis]|uniref:hypothetical protein n=1 Tax=Pseudomonas orientalis TaxID=76758 RepID=UPI0013DDA25F|nr:hypothetical protein [Pseudomonas orientalis]